MIAYNQKGDAALIEAAMMALSKTGAPDVDEAEMSRVWLRARLVSFADRDRPAEGLIGSGVVASASVAGLAALGLVTMFWGGVYQAAPFAALVAVVSLSSLALLGGALVFKTWYADERRNTWLESARGTR